LLPQMISLILVTLLLVACGGGNGTHPAIGVVKQYIELGKDLEEDANGLIDIGPVISKALELWDGSLPVEGNEMFVPLLSQYYETITYEVVEDKGDEVQVQVSFSDPNDAEMRSEMTFDYRVVRRDGKWRIARHWPPLWEDSIRPGLDDRLSPGWRYQEETGAPRYTYGMFSAGKVAS